MKTQPREAAGARAASFLRSRLLPPPFLPPAALVVLKLARGKSQSRGGGRKELSRRRLGRSTHRQPAAHCNGGQEAAAAQERLSLRDKSALTGSGARTLSGACKEESNPEAPSQARGNKG